MKTCDKPMASKDSMALWTVGGRPIAGRNDTYWMTLSHKDEHGVETRYQYDSLDRVIEEKTAPATNYEATRKTEYAVVEVGIGYQITQTEANGVQTRYTTDGMERVISRKTRAK
ncbi:hypothetical protein H9Q70_000027 [Fusarium xylarioides]|nr:hypothetical protein H9Q70_000027 [Fusarium xylarioides]